MEDTYPGMWQRWFKNQCVGIGWPAADGHHLDGATRRDHGWSRARKAIKEVALGDFVIVTLRDHRVGRLGIVTGKRIQDDEWDPLVPRNPQKSPYGEMGRRILVRWDLTTGPDSRDLVTVLPPGCRFSAGELRPTISRIRSRSVEKLRAAMNEPSHWDGLLTHFDYERALSGYIAAYPHRLEDGLLPHPDKRVREKVFRNKSRSDVLLTDRKDRPVVVECKQGAPKLEHLTQLRNYMRLLHAETRKVPRGILVHGGARKLAADVSTAAAKKSKIEIVQYALGVDFASCN